VNETAAIVHKELEDLTHDQLLLTKIMSLTSSLTQEYEVNMLHYLILLYMSIVNNI